MLTDQLIDVTRQTLMVMLILSIPVLLAGLTIGLFVSVMQAVTQIQEQTLSFVPKIIGMVLVAIVAMPWMVTRLMTFSAQMFGPLPTGG
ncbi:MAG: flagellar biosynthesis protein FliQ [Phycisphaeraceae bacterium]|nr:flagellar biosynthesis protein FliQ [Phycisphaeraceae bacterium]